MSKSIKIIGASENNLKNVTIQIPKNRITSISGISGSGKTSLMFNVFVTEADRRARILCGIETDYEKFNRPSFDQMEYTNNIYGVSQKALRKSEISSVGTASRVNELIKDLLIEKGEITCECGTEVDNICSIEVILRIMNHDAELNLLYKIKNKNHQITNKALELLETIGVNKIYDANIQKLDSRKILNYTQTDIYALIEKGSINSLKNIDSRKILLVKNKAIIYDFSYQTFCKECLKEYQVKSRSLFTKSELSDINGRCKSCDGTGLIKRLNFHDLIDNNKPLNSVFLKIPHNGKAYKYTYIQDSDIKKIVGSKNYDSNFTELTSNVKENLINFLEKKILPHENKTEINNYIIKETCTSCKGTGFSYKTNAVRIKNMNFFDFSNLIVAELYNYIQNDKILSLVNHFKNLSLSHLQLSRSTNTLSGGELQRLKFIKYLSEETHDSIIVLDEPSSGLSQLDLTYLLKEIINIKERNNTVLVIDHSDYLIQNSDYNLSFGFTAGSLGGHISSHPYEQNSTYTRRKREVNEFLNFKTLNNNNLKNISISIPLNCITTIVGVSGSGKTSLVQALISELSNEKFSHFNVIYANQDDVSTNSRSTIATYVGIFDEIREIFSQAPNSKKLGLNTSYFSSNTYEGACDTCDGSGLYQGTTCKKCYGSKYSSKVLAIKHKNFNIRNLLDTPISELKSLNLSKNINTLADILTSMGAGYLSLGRSTSTLSGGECQRVKLSKFLLKRSFNSNKNHNIIFLDEPTKGLSKKDTLNIISLIDEILNNNSTIISVEHNIFFINNSDYLIEIGPKAGKEGGEIMFSGSEINYQKPKYKNTNKPPISILQENKLSCEKWLDDDFFKKIKYYYNNFYFKKTTNLSTYKNYESILSTIKNETIYFCPFIDDLYSNRFISKTTFNMTIKNLISLGITDCIWQNHPQKLKNIKATFNQDSYFDFFCEAHDFDLCFILGGNSFVTLNKSQPHFHSLRLIDYKEKIIGSKIINKNIFNAFYSKCEYCSGSGKVPNIKPLILESNFKINEIDFYNDIKFKDVNLFNIKKSIKKFKEEMIIDLDKKFSDLNELETFYAIYGIKEIYFVESTDRKNAISDQVRWHGLLKTLKYDKSITHSNRTTCLMCNGTGYIKELDYYLCEEKAIYEH